MDDALYHQLLQKMATKGFNTDRMIRTSQPLTESESEITGKLVFTESDDCANLVSAAFA